jgi:hypothetical protein
LLHAPKFSLLSFTVSTPSTKSELELNARTVDSPHNHIYFSPMSANEDVERGRSIKNPRGFPGLAELIAQDPDQETYVFRKFSKLTAWNLIYKQTELASYELEIDAIEAQLASDGHSDSVARSWKKLHEEAEKMGTCAHKIKELSDKISTKLSEYRGSRNLIFRRNTNHDRLCAFGSKQHRPIEAARCSRSYGTRKIRWHCKSVFRPDGNLFGGTEQAGSCCSSHSRP